MGVLQLNLTGGEPTLTRRPRRADRARQESKTLLQSDHLRRGPQRRKTQAVFRRGLGPYPAFDSRRRKRTCQRIRRNQSSRAEASRRRAMIKKFNLAFTMNMVIHRQNICAAPRHDRARGGSRGGSPRNRARSVLRMGVQESRDAASDSRAGQRVDGHDLLPREKNSKTKFASNSRRRIISRNFRNPAWAAWERRALLIDPAGRVMPCHSAMVLPGMHFRQCPRQISRGDLGAVRGVQPLSRGRLDERALLKLRSKDQRLRWLPLPGFLGHRRRKRNRPGLLAFTGSRRKSMN